MVEVDQRIIAESIFVKKDNFLEVRLIRDQDLPWFVIIPLIEGATELIDLSETEQKKLMDEVNNISKLLKEKFRVDKINIGMIGNMVRQLHVHVVGRFENDRQFPKPIWGYRIDIEENSPDVVERLRQCSILSH